MCSRSNNFKKCPYLYDQATGRPFERRSLIFYHEFCAGRLASLARGHRCFSRRALPWIARGACQIQNPISMKFASEWDSRIGPVLYVTINSRKLGLCLCHRIPERTVPFFGLEKFLCSRCVGVLVGMAVGVTLLVSGLHSGLGTAVLLSIPIACDGCTQLMGLRESSNPLRMATGFLFGLTANHWWGTFVV